MIESKAKTYLCPMSGKNCLGRDCMMWAWYEDGSDGPGSQNDDPNKLGDCSLTHRRMSVWRTTQDMPETDYLRQINATVNAIWDFVRKK